MDYKKLGLKVGLEIHQQLDTHKLFCECPSVMQEGKPDLVVERRLRAVAGELGVVDPAARQAYLRGTTYVYNIYDESNCHVELDEEPPHKMNGEALKTTLLVALLLNAKIVDEIHVMRKTVIDGSNTSGFQRTSQIAMNGTLEFGGSKIGIPTFCLEEDAARIVETHGNKITYNLDRLGVPLIEIATDPDIHTPEGAREVAKALGDILRATKAVKRGIGTIRQDLNISIAKGSRIELKGVQELRLISKAVEYEVQRQFRLLELKNELTKRGIKKLEPKVVDVTNLFSKSPSKVIQKAVKNKGIVLAIKLDGFLGLLGKELIPNRRLGTELADYAKAYGSKGLFHSDELPNYGITEQEISSLRKRLKCKEKDGFVIIAEVGDVAKRSMEAVVERSEQALVGVPGETRKALPDATSSYLRPLPGPSRMYPETDLPPVVVTPSLLAELKKGLPELPWKQIDSLGRKYKLSHDLAEEIYRSEYFDYFTKLAKGSKTEPSIIASAMTSTLRSVEKKDIKLGYGHFKELFKALDSGKFSKEAIPEILEAWFEKPEKPLEKLITELGLEGISTKNLEKIIDTVISKNQQLIKERGERAVQPLMGTVMAEVRGKADGKLIMELLRKKVLK